MGRGSSQGDAVHVRTLVPIFHYLGFSEIIPTRPCDASSWHQLFTVSHWEPIEATRTEYSQRCRYAGPQRFCSTRSARVSLLLRA